MSAAIPECRDPSPPLLVRWLRRVPYGRGLEIQQSLVDRRRRGSEPDTLLLLEHEPVVTLGRSSDSANVLLTTDELDARGIELFDTGRGGDVTYHGPGQLVGYPILALPEGRRDAHRYLRSLETALILVAADYGLRAGRVDGLTGVWIGNYKLASIGVRLSSRWITSHGFALNVAADLSGFETIVPCGIADREVTSLARRLGFEPSLEEVASRTAARVAEVLGYRPVLAVEPAEKQAV